MGDLLVTIHRIYSEPWVYSPVDGLDDLQHPNKGCLFIKPGEILFTLRISEEPRRAMPEIPIMLQFIYKDMVMVSYFLYKSLGASLRKYTQGCKVKI